MMLKMLLSLALILLSQPGVWSQRPREVHTMAGQLVVLQCPRSSPVWTSHTDQGTDVITDLSPAELMQKNMLLHGKGLVILRASVNHQGNYSCHLSQSWFKLTVHTAKTKEYEEWTTYPKTCDSQRSCRLYCPDVNVPPNITRDGLTWRKEGKRADDYFKSVEEKDSGVYTCTRSFLYLSQTYNVSFTVELTVTPKKPEKTSHIMSPPNATVFNVTMGEQKVIQCKADLYSDFDQVLWFILREREREREQRVEADRSQSVSVWCLIMTVVKILLVHPLLLLLLLTAAAEVHTMAGQLVVLQCPSLSPVWTSHTDQGMDVITDLSPAELMQKNMLFHGKGLVILRASVNHQGNYSCHLRNTSRQSWFKLTVHTVKSKEYEKWTTYPKTCDSQRSCRLYCPDVNVPPNITGDGITWRKEGKRADNYFKSVEEKDSGVYTCTRSFLYLNQTYNVSFTVELTVTPKKPEKTSHIMSPRNATVFDVTMGEQKVIHCKADLYSEFDQVQWFSGESAVDRNISSRVFYNITEEKHGDEIKVTASLVFKKVLEEDLTKNYTCRLSSVSVQNPTSVCVTLRAKTAGPSYIALAPSIVAIVVVVFVTVIVYVELKIDITLFLRDTLGCFRRTSDGRSYDAFLMCYESDTDAGLNADDRKWLERVLEEKFGYSLCLYDRDVLPGRATADAVLDCVEQSRTVVLVPTSSDPGLGSGLLSAIHESLVERQSRLILIQTETTQESASGPLTEALQFLGEAGVCVTWKGSGTASFSSSFWKQLRYYLPASPKLQLLPLKIKDAASYQNV
ncbi:hypothetical protein INR49_004174 [Caranx melampygus]|nr:hypothetical protein INR49_004174 [Caranx melampygus]